MIDLSHIDGNHDRTAVMFDLKTYSRKVRSALGFVILEAIGAGRWQVSEVS